ncbi:MAG TPA: hypothetical protein VM307_06440 [Egibacteraceae bacterium]|nr:hypothetical protein [Egibacteraceae bacterium]
MAASDFHDELLTLDFVPQQKDRRGTVQYARRPNRYLTEWVHDNGDEALFTWEFDLGEFCSAVGWQIGAAEHSFQILYPQFDVRIARDIDAVAVEVQRLEQQLRSLDLADPAL